MSKSTDQSTSTSTRITGSDVSQSDKFKDAAQELDCDPDEKRWEERLRKVAKQRSEKPAGT